MNNTDTTSTTSHNKTKVLNGYKKTAIGIIPMDWKVKTLGELSDIKTGKKDNQNKVEDGIYPFFVRSKNIERINSYSYDGEAILIPGEGNIGEIFHYINGKFDYHQRVYKISDFTNETLGKYIYYYFQVFFLKETIRHSVKATVDSLRLPTFTEMVIHLPPLPEQQKIAEILSTWDRAILNCNFTIKSIKARNKGLAQQLLTGKKRLIGFSDKWINTHLGKIVKRVTKKNEELNDTVVTISAQRGFVLQEDFFKKRVASDTLSGYYLLKKGQFAYNKSYSNGYPMGAFKRLNDFEKAVVTTLYICFELKENVCPDYMVYFFENGLMTNNLMKVAKEGGRAHGLLNIGLDDFLNLELTIPSFEEQKAISQVLETADQELKSYETKLEALQLQKKGLMQQLLTGKIRVNVK